MFISNNTIQFIESNYSEFLHDDQNSNEELPNIYVIHKKLNELPIFYSGSSKSGRRSYMGSSKNLKNDILIHGIDNFDKHIIFIFKSSISSIKLREIESVLQQMENHRNSPYWYNLTDRTGPGVPKNLYKGDNRTLNMLNADLIRCSYSGDNRTQFQQLSDIKRKTCSGENRSDKMKNADIIRSLYSADNRTESQQLSDIKRKSYYGINRLESQKTADEINKYYKGDNRTSAQKIHDEKMCTYKGDNRTPAQKIHDEKMCTYKGDNRLETQKIGDIQKSKKQGVKLSLINDNGDILSSHSMRALCKEHKFSRTQLFLLKNNKIDSYKGWKFIKL